MPITAIVTAYQRIEQTQSTLERLRACRPAPDEILVHVDGNQTQCEEAIRRAFPEIRTIVSQESIGPGGGRNKLLAAAVQELVASFDDDSYPHDLDFFARVGRAVKEFPQAAVYAATIYNRGEPVPDEASPSMQQADFGGGGCVFSRFMFLKIGGYVPLPVAYGMEEVDLALRLHAEGQRVVRVPRLRVFHDTDYSGHVSPKLVSGTIANAALLVYLRYPPSRWPRGMLQVLNAVRYAVRKRRYRGILAGLLMIPCHLYHHRQYRSTASSAAVHSYLALRRNPRLLG